MGGFFGVVSRHDVVLDCFFGVDYHSHLGTRRAGMVVYDKQDGYQKQIHSIENTPFRTKFEHDAESFKGRAAIGCISDSDPQPLLVRSHLGFYALSTIGCINNADELIENFFSDNRQFMAMSSGRINSTELIAARDRLGRLPILIGKDENGYAVSFESFAYSKLGYRDEHELGPGEIVRIDEHGWEALQEPGDKMRICAFLWTYYGFSTSRYEGKSVEISRYKNGASMAKMEMENGTMPEADFVAGMPDSGIPHAMGYANESHMPLARPFIKYTPTWPRSFTPSSQDVRRQVAKMKQIPVPELIEGKRLLFVDDSIVRGTQMQETVDFLYGCGAKEVHMRSACPPVMYGCKFLNFSRSNSDMELLTRRTIQELEGAEGQKHLDEYADAKTQRGKCLLSTICEKLGFKTLRYQELDNLLDSIGIDRDKICTYCWTGKD